MAVRPDGAGAVALEEDVVQEAEQGLKSEKCEKHNADDRVCVVECVEVPGHPDADAESHRVEDETEDLEQAVDNPQAWEGR